MAAAGGLMLHRSGYATLHVAAIGEWLRPLTS